MKWKFFVWTLALVWSAGSAAAQMPKAEVVGKSRVTFEDTYEGTIVTHVFKLKNTGAVPLMIVRSWAKCFCTTTSYTSPIMPGETGDVTMKIDTLGFGGKTISKSMHIITNDPDHPDMVFKLSGTVVSCLKVEPSRRLYLRGAPGETVSAEVKIFPVEGFTVELKAPEIIGLDDRVKITMTRDGDAYLLTATTTLEKGKFWGKVRLIPTDPALPAVSVGVRTVCVEPTS